MTQPTVGLGYLVSLFAVVASGSVLPFVPTGAAVSVAAALAEQDHLLLIVLVVVFGAAGAYVDDVATYPWRRFAVADIGAVTLWSAMYSAGGLVGRAVFPKTWEGVAAAITLVLLISLASNLWTRRRNRHVGSAS
jgi:membrane protein DedA with SNARE-associated domain